MMGGFAIFPDGHQHPSALFIDLEAAMDWGIETYGGGAFRIQWLDVLPVEREDKQPLRQQQD